MTIYAANISTVYRIIYIMVPTRHSSACLSKPLDPTHNNMGGQRESGRERERERERERQERVRERERECVCERERECVRVCEKERKKERKRLN